MQAVLILSGGLDSTVLAYHLRSLGMELSLLTFNYGQKHNKEIMYAELCSSRLGASWKLLDLNFLKNLLPGSSLLSEKVEIPNGHFQAETMKSTVVPNRNAIMLSIAWGHAVAINADMVVFGAHAGDHHIYPDCRPEFHVSMERAMKLGNEGFGNKNLKLFNPFQMLTKGQIVERGYELGVPFEETWSCYKGGDYHCGLCGTCVERREAFMEVGIKDPTEYQDRKDLNLMMADLDSWDLDTFVTLGE